jgi:hypothetical protein
MTVKFTALQYITEAAIVNILQWLYTTKAALQYITKAALQYITIFGWQKQLYSHNIYYKSMLQQHSLAFHQCAFPQNVVIQL